MARLALLAAALAVAGLVAICAGLSRPGDAQTDELMGQFDLYRPAISSLDLNSPSPLDYHTFDYTRPDFAASMDMNLLSGSIGMPSYHFFKQHGAASMQTLAAASALKNSHEERNDRRLEERAQARSDLPNEERAETARCNGMLHACANWMALKTGKMRIITYGEGSWCTDDEVLGKACYDEPKTIASDKLLDIPEEGKPMSEELWATIKQSCPIINDCPKPNGWSTNEEHSVYRALPSILAEYQRARIGLAESCSKCVSQRVAAQQRFSLLMRPQADSPKLYWEGSFVEPVSSSLPPIGYYVDLEANPGERLEEYLEKQRKETDDP